MLVSKEKLRRRLALDEFGQRPILLLATKLAVDVVKQQIDGDGGNLGQVQIHGGQLWPAFARTQAVIAGHDLEIARDVSAEVGGSLHGARGERIDRYA